MKKTKRILQISIGTTVFGGVEQMIYQIYKNIDREKIQFDLLSPNLTTYGIHEDEILKMGGKIIELKADRSNLKGKLKYYVRLYKFLKKNSYEIVHINSGAFLFVLMVSIICRLAGIKKIIVHSHNARQGLNLGKRVVFDLLKPILALVATDYMACSELAGRSMFNKRLFKQNKVIIIKNGIDIQKYKFNLEIRNKYRMKLGIDENIVYGHVGRFELQKNHEFLIDIFFHIQKIQPEAVLLLIGDGELKEKIIRKLEGLKIKDKVKFLGVRKDVPELLQAIDCFILPSLYEGLPVVGVEAQASGVPLFCSDSITEELRLLDTTKYISLNTEANEWAKLICKSIDNKDCRIREEAYKIVEEKGYDIKKTAEQLENIYLGEEVD